MGSMGGFAIDLFEHSPQSANLAHRAGEDKEYVVCALLHDIRDSIASFNHAELAGEILRLFVSKANHWMVARHGIF